MRHEALFQFQRHLGMRYGGPTDGEIGAERLERLQASGRRELAEQESRFSETGDGYHVFMGRMTARRYRLPIPDWVTFALDFFSEQLQMRVNFDDRSSMADIVLESLMMKSERGRPNALGRQRARYRETLLALDVYWELEGQEKERRKKPLEELFEKIGKRNGVSAKTVQRAWLARKDEYRG